MPLSELAEARLTEAMGYLREAMALTVDLHARRRIHHALMCATTAKAGQPPLRFLPDMRGEAHVVQEDQEG